MYLLAYIVYSMCIDDSMHLVLARWPVSRKDFSLCFCSPETKVSHVCLGKSHQKMEHLLCDGERTQICVWKTWTSLTFPAVPCIFIKASHECTLWYLLSSLNYLTFYNSCDYIYSHISYEKQICVLCTQIYIYIYELSINKTNQNFISLVKLGLIY